MSDDDDELDLKPKKKTALKPKVRRPPARFLLASRIVKLLALAVGSFISLIGWMSIFGLVLDNSIVRLVLALIPTVGLGLLLVDRVLKRFTIDDRGVATLDVFAVWLMVQALALVALGGFTHNAFTKEGDRYARTGSKGSICRHRWLICWTPWPNTRARHRPMSCMSMVAGSARPMC